MENTQKLLLEILSFQLFGGDKPKVNNADIVRLLSEAKAHSVFSAVFPFVSEKLQSENPSEFEKYNQRFLAKLVTNTNNLMNHGELHALFTENNIPYVILKGAASAYYYPDPSIRDMGDVDFLINESDFERAGKLLESVGFTAKNPETARKHIAYSRPLASTLEMHRTVNGIPSGEVGKLIKAEIDAAIKTARLAELDGVKCLIPDKPRHGLILLLHTASHMTGEGIGLRHLCDWAVFEAGLSNEEFRGLFEEKLKSFGLWRFAQILTLVSEKYLGAPKKAWASEIFQSVKDEDIDAVINDILNSGNFGRKDYNRYREIKYISNRGESTVDDKGLISQVFATLNKRVYLDFDFINRHRAFLPVGWIAEGGRYAWLLLTGKRKTKGTSDMLKEASKRKDIYSKMELFKK